MAKPYEWETDDPRGQLDIPDELVKAQHFRWTTIPNEVGLKGTCESYETIFGGVRLLSVLVDTSERVMQTVLKKRVTFRKELLLLGTIGVVMFPFNDDEESRRTKPR